MPGPQTRRDDMHPGAGKILNEDNTSYDFTAGFRALAVMVENFPFALGIARGNISGITHVNKFGLSTNVDNGVDTDVWDRANVTHDQDIWIAPTQARIHNIVSSSASDNGDPAGVGARTIRVYGLPGWDTAQVTEDIIMDGTTNVPTENAYVIIHRMKVLTKGSTSSNVGVITATAQIDGTITAQINADNGQTLMAICGIPSTQTAFLTSFYASYNKMGGGTGDVDVSLLFNPEPDAELLNFLVKFSEGQISSASAHFIHPYNPYRKFSGPGILKLQGNGSANNLSMSGGFDLIFVDNQ